LWTVNTLFFPAFFKGKPSDLSLVGQGTEPGPSGFTRQLLIISIHAPQLNLNNAAAKEKITTTCQDIPHGGEQEGMFFCFVFQLSLFPHYYRLEPGEDDGIIVTYSKRPEFQPVEQSDGKLTVFPTLTTSMLTCGNRSHPSRWCLPLLGCM